MDKLGPSSGALGRYGLFTMEAILTERTFLLVVDAEFALLEKVVGRSATEQSIISPYSARKAKMIRIRIVDLSALM